MSIAFLPLHVEEAFRAGPPRLVDCNQRLRRQLVLFCDSADQASHLICTTARASRNDELDRLGWLPRMGRGRDKGSCAYHRCNCRHRERSSATNLAFHRSPPGYWLPLGEPPPQTV